ncbi:MAG: COR domain-containing protein [Hyphomicrobiaceae bacterium]
MASPRFTAASAIKAYRNNKLRYMLDLSGFGLRQDELEALREELSSLPRLKYLYLGLDRRSKAATRASNSLTSVPDWLFVTNPGLTRLDLSFNHLTSIPNALANCARLEWLNLSHNSLAHVPDVISKLKELQELFISHNKIISLPESLGSLTELQNISLDEMAMEWPPRKILSQGTKPMLDFLRNISLSGGEPIHEGKVILVGNGDHGKTTIRLWLEKGKFIRSLTTRGGEISRIRVPLSTHDSDERGVINVWDFGGQEHYRAAQRSLFSSDAFFVLVCKSRGSVEEGNVPEWLQLINQVQADANVLLIFTHYEEGTREPPLDTIPAHLRRMVPPGNVYKLDATQSSGGIEAVKSRIIKEVITSKAFKQLWPTSWLKVRARLINPDGSRTRDFITQDDFKSLCIECGVAANHVSALAGALSLIDTGNASERAPNIIILNPEWLLKAISYVMDDDVVRSNNGVLDETIDLPRIWRDHKRQPHEKPIVFSDEVWGELLFIMAGQGLAYRLTDTDWLIPELVTAEEPETLRWSTSHGAVHRICTLNGPIYGLAALLTAELHHLHSPKSRQFWRGGAFFRLSQNRGELLARVDGRKEIRFEARGSEAKQLLWYAEMAVRNITWRYWPETKRSGEEPYDFEVPCPSDDCRGRFYLPSLLADYKAGKRVSNCGGRRPHQHRIEQLLNGVVGDEEQGVQDLLRKLDELWAGIETFEKPPRLIHVEETNGLTSTTRRISLVSELSKEVIIASARVIEIDDEWFKLLKDLGRVAVKIVSNGAVDIDVEDADDEKVDVNQLGLGTTMREPGQPIPPSIAKILVEMAHVAKMRQTKVNGRYLWVTAEEADRSDPTRAKE